MKRFKGRTAVVTGGAQGIGLATAERLHAEGSVKRRLAVNPPAVTASRAIVKPIASRARLRAYHTLAA